MRTVTSAIEQREVAENQLSRRLGRNLFSRHLHNRPDAGCEELLEIAAISRMAYPQQMIVDLFHGNYCAPLSPLYSGGEGSRLATFPGGVVIDYKPSTSSIVYRPAGRSARKHAAWSAPRA